MWNPNRFRSCNQCADGKYRLQNWQESLLGCNQEYVYRFRCESADEGKIILATDKEDIYRHSFYANFYIWDFEKETLTPVAEGKQRLATLSPDNNKVAYVQDNNLFYKDLTNNQIIQITNDGEYNKIINGATDWVNEEEFGLARGFYWSPDGNAIAFLRFDETAVKEFTMQYYNNDMYP